MRAATSPHGKRGGFSFLEMLVAFTLLGMGLAGLGPLVVMQLKLSRRLARVKPTDAEVANQPISTATPPQPYTTAVPYLCPFDPNPDHPSMTYYLAPPVAQYGTVDSMLPATTQWLRKLGASAPLSLSQPTWRNESFGVPAYKAYKSSPPRHRRSTTRRRSRSRSANDGGDAMTVRKAGAGRGRGGYTFTEMVVVSLLLVILTSILATVWSAFCRAPPAPRPRCRLATEANLLAASLARDVGDTSPAPQARPF